MKKANNHFESVHLVDELALKRLARVSEVGASKQVHQPSEQSDYFYQFEKKSAGHKRPLFYCASFLREIILLLQKRNYIGAIVLASSLFCLAQAYALSAEDNASIARDQGNVIQTQQKYEDDKRQQSELKAIAIEAEEIKEEEESENFPDDGKLIQDLSSIRCYRVKKINFTQNEILSKDEENILTQDYEGRCLTYQRVKELLREVNEQIIKNEFITSKAVLAPNQNISNEEITVQIIEGRVENVIINDDKFSDKLQRFSAFGIINEGEVLNVKNYAMGIGMMNRLPSNKAEMSVDKGSKENYSVIKVSNSPKNRLRTNFALDNLGSVFVGRRRDIATVNYDNLLYLNDSFTFSRTANDTDSERDNRKNNSLSASWVAPFKDHIVTLNYTRYLYNFLKGDSRASGSSVTRGANVETYLGKNKKYKISSIFGLTNKEVHSFVNDIAQASTHNVTIFNAGFANSWYFHGANLLLKPTYSRGLSSMGATSASASAANGTHAQFDMFKFYANYSRNLEVPRLQIPFSYNLSFDSQISDRRLYSSEQFFVGGAYSVRGFVAGTISGDSGYLLKNELKFNVGKMLSALDSHGFKLHDGVSKLSHNFTISPFYDYGYTVLKSSNQIGGRLASFGTKIGFENNGLKANVTYARITSRSVLLNGRYKESQAIYFDVSKEVAFD